MADRFWAKVIGPKREFNTEKSSAQSAVREVEENKQADMVEAVENVLWDLSAEQLTELLAHAHKLKRDSLKLIAEQERKINNLRLDY